MRGVAHAGLEPFGVLEFAAIIFYVRDEATPRKLWNIGSLGHGKGGEAHIFDNHRWCDYLTCSDVVTEIDRVSGGLPRGIDDELTDRYGHQRLLRYLHDVRLQHAVEEGHPITSPGYTHP